MIVYKYEVNLMELDETAHYFEYVHIKGDILILTTQFYNLTILPDETITVSIDHWIYEYMN